MDRLFLNNEAARITSATPRQIQEWTDKGLVIPTEEGKGSGKKRGYDIINLYEIRLVKVLRDDYNHSIWLVKNILDDLREDQSLARWAADPLGYFLEVFKRIQSNVFEDNVSDSLDLHRYEDFLKTFHKAFTKNPDSKTSGVLFFFQGKDIKQRCWILPQRPGSTMYIETTMIEILYFYLGHYDVTLCVNLGKIKDKVDVELGGIV
ncbi:MAG: MerR family transcriptional regulator [Candidatus Altiarchaeota archaeon]